MPLFTLVAVLSCSPDTAPPPEVDRVSLLMQNPVASDVHIVPDTVIPGMRPKCKWEFTDGDGHGQRGSLVDWFVGTAWLNQPSTSRFLPDDQLLVPGNTIQCRVTPRDTTGAWGSIETGTAETVEEGNILIVLLDDVGVDQLGPHIYDVGGGIQAQTPTMDRLAERGVVFDRAYGNPACSPTRATIQTGLYSYRTGVTAGIQEDSTWWLKDELTTTFVERLATGRQAASLAAFDTSYIGKWHLVSLDPAPDHLTHPYDSGWEYSDVRAVDSPGDHDNWENVIVDGTDAPVEDTITTYMTTYVFEQAALRIATMTPPWLLLVAPRPTHRPYHCPPDGLYDDSNGLCDGYWSDPEMYRAALEAVDFELDSLLQSMTDVQWNTTTIILVGDNGTFIDSIDPTSAIDTTTDRFKGTPYELGVRVPLIVSGPLVNSPGISDAIVQTTDIFATVAALAAIPLDATELSAVDSTNLLPLVHDTTSAGERTVAYCEIVGPVEEPPVSPDGGGHSVRNATYRLVHNSGDEYELYDLSVDLWEEDGTDLIANAGGEPADLDGSDPTAAAAFCELKEALEPVDSYPPLTGSSGSFPTACP